MILSILSLGAWLANTYFFIVDISICLDFLAPITSQNIKRVTVLILRVRFSLVDEGMINGWVQR